MRYCLLAAYLFMFLIPSAHACRCRPEELLSYFEKADYVFIARIKRSNDQSVATTDQITLDYSLSGQVYKGDINRLQRLVTPDSSAACGLNVSEETPHLIFAQEDSTSPGSAIAHSCNGTRPFDISQPDKSVDFPDYSGEQLLKALYNLKIRSAVQEQGIGGVPLKHSINGMLKFSEFSQSEEQYLFSKPITLKLTPTDNSPAISTVMSLNELESREIGYELRAALVFERRGIWSRVQTVKKQSGWLKDGANRNYQPLSQLLTSRLSYLTAAWDRFIWPDPGAGIPVPYQSIDDEVAVAVLGSTRIANSLWFHVKLFKNNPCNGESSEKFSRQGWVPAWNSGGENTIWFWSRGC